MLRICAEMIDVEASLVGAQATRRIQPAESYEGTHKQLSWRSRGL